MGLRAIGAVGAQAAGWAMRGASVAPALSLAKRSVTIAGQEVRIPSPENLVALKLHASRQRAQASVSHQDWLDIVQVVRRQGLDIEDSGFRALVIKYGGSDAPDILIRLLRQSDGGSA